MGRRKAAWLVAVLVALLCVWLLLRHGAITVETAQSTPFSGGGGEMQGRGATADRERGRRERVLVAVERIERRRRVAGAGGRRAAIG